MHTLPNLHRSDLQCRVAWLAYNFEQRCGLLVTLIDGAAPDMGSCIRLFESIAAPEWVRRIDVRSKTGKPVLAYIQDIKDCWLAVNLERNDSVAQHVVTD